MRNPNSMKKSTAAWRKIGDTSCYFRSSWESNFARYLQLLLDHKKIQSWHHEPETFWFRNIQRGTCSYLPDFKVVNLDDSTTYYEVKGFLDQKSHTKIKRFRKYYPKERLIVIDKKWFQKNNPVLRGIIKDWEHNGQLAQTIPKENFT